PALLDTTGCQYAVVAQAVRVLESAGDHVRHALKVLMDVHRPGRARRENGVMEAPQRSDGCRRCCWPWSAGEVPTHHETGSGIHKDLRVATNPHGSRIHRKQSNRLSKTLCAVGALEMA